MSILVAHSKWKDRPRDWDSKYCEPYITGFDPLAFQKELDKISGLDKRGNSILLLEWGGNAVTREKLDGLGNIIEEPKFKLKRKYQTTLDKSYYFIPIRRWIITQYTTPEQLGVGDDEDVLKVDIYGILRKIAEKPKEGKYEPLVYVGDHQWCPKDCCKKSLCLGDYKDPGRDELDWVRDCSTKLKREMITNPYEKINPQQLQKILKEANDIAELESENVHKELDIKLDNLIEHTLSNN